MVQPNPDEHSTNCQYACDAAAACDKHDLKNAPKPDTSLVNIQAYSAEGSLVKTSVHKTANACQLGGKLYA